MKHSPSALAATVSVLVLLFGGTPRTVEKLDDAIFAAFDLARRTS
jgi:hypothetical protein